jgi:hypothetical protein
LKLPLVSVGKSAGWLDTAAAEEDYSPCILLRDVAGWVPTEDDLQAGKSTLDRLEVDMMDFDDPSSGVDNQPVADCW